MKFVKLVKAERNSLKTTTDQVYKLLEEQLNPYMGGILNTKTFDRMLQLAQTFENPEDKKYIKVYTKLKEIIKPLEDLVFNRH